MVHRRPVPVALLTCLFLLSAGFSVPNSKGLKLSTKAWVASTASDTVRASVTAGAPLIRPLPSTIAGREVSEYRLIRGPALSGVAGHSFTWITHAVDPGTYDASLQAAHPNAAPDTLVVRVVVRP